jgi:hypothetical protein
VRAGGGVVGFAPAWVPKCSTATKPPAAKSTTTAQTVTTIHVRGRFLLAACSPELITREILPGSSRAQGPNLVLNGGCDHAEAFGVGELGALGLPNVERVDDHFAQG